MKYAYRNFEYKPGILKTVIGYLFCSFVVFTAWLIMSYSNKNHVTLLSGIMLTNLLYVMWSNKEFHRHYADSINREIQILEDDFFGRF